MKKTQPVAVSQAVIELEAALQQKHLLAYWQGRALALAQQVEDMRASLEEKVKEAVEARLAEINAIIGELK
jgi:hypothetical protein